MIIYVHKNASKSIVVPIASTPDGMALKFYTLLLKVNCFEGLLNWCKTDGMVNDNSSSCNSYDFFKN